MKTLPWIALLLFFTACSHSVLPDSRELPAPPARTLVSRKIPEATAQSYFEFDWGPRLFRVGHGVWKVQGQDSTWNQSYGYGPVVWVRQGLSTRVLDLREEFPSYFVSQVFHDSLRGRIILFLDEGMEGPAPAYVVWISEDRGEHWFRGQDLQRPPGTFPPAELESFFLDSEGKGAAWLRLEASQLKPEDRGSLPLNAKLYYRVSTENSGRSWSGPKSAEFTSVLEQAEERHR